MKNEKSFSQKQGEKQIVWRKTNISTSEMGSQSKERKTGKPVYHQHIVPRNNWKENLWSHIRTDLPEYLKKKEIQAHAGTHNLLSSWILCANLYFPVRLNQSMCSLMCEFLKLKISKEITEISGVELEFAFPEDNALHPAKLLGEEDGSRGSGQTSPDVAFLVKTKKGKGIILTECKYTEHSFYRCSARRPTDKGERKGNPHPEKCMQAGKDYDYGAICHQLVWGRKYWNNLKLSEFGQATLNRCPAATGGYQLFRQQALAEGIMKTGDYNLVASCVAFDERNNVLIKSLKSTGLSDFQTDWGGIFSGNIIFKTWTHQEWVQFVRINQVRGEHDSWLNYLNQRYNY